jgi:four helix bundle protein
MRRCGVSVSSNIAEGFSIQGKIEKIQFYYMAKGSLTELQNQLLISRDVGYIDKKTFDELANQTILASKLLMGLIRSVKKF